MTDSNFLGYSVNSMLFFKFGSMSYVCNKIKFLFGKTAGKCNCTDVAETLTVDGSILDSTEQENMWFSYALHLLNPNEPNLRPTIQWYFSPYKVNDCFSDLVKPCSFDFIWWHSYVRLSISALLTEKICYLMTLCKYYFC